MLASQQTVNIFQDNEIMSEILSEIKVRSLQNNDNMDESSKLIHEINKDID